MNANTLPPFAHRIPLPPVIASEPLVRAGKTIKTSHSLDCFASLAMTGG
ncbi:MAG: hypothetical protein LBT00_04630 [Spirochaetaceae bacterium]|nr:hypothetical protein [Spirochaetaceae bacterium]